MRLSHPLAIIFSLLVCGPAHANTFYDWTANCDNLKGCTALGFGQGWENEVTGGFIRVERAGDSASPAKVRLTFFAEGATGTIPLTLTVDGEPIDGVAAERTGTSGPRGFTTELSPQEVKPFIAALKKGMIIDLTNVNAKSNIKLSLHGAVAALLSIDEIQGRVGTKTALIRRGDKTDAAAVPPAPIIVAAKLPLNVEANNALAAKLREDLKKELSEDCDAPDERYSMDEVKALDASRALVGLVCSSGAYNETRKYWIVTGSDIQKAVPVAFEAPDHKGGPNLGNADFDRRTGILSFFWKGRGLGDCGERGKYVWTGKRFALLEYAALETCGGGVTSEDWPILWRAKVM